MFFISLCVHACSYSTYVRMHDVVEAHAIATNFL